MLTISTAAFHVAIWMRGDGAVTVIDIWPQAAAGAGLFGLVVVFAIARSVATPPENGVSLEMA